jgi:hypothetical protein
MISDDRPTIKTLSFHALTSSRLSTLSDMRARNLGSECVYFRNVDDFEGDPPRLQYLIDPALPQPLSA